MRNRILAIGILLSLPVVGPVRSQAGARGGVPGSTVEPLSSMREETESLEVPRTEQFWLRSEANGVNYRLEVALPHSHVEGGGPYPLLLLLDTHYSFLIARNITDHLSERRDLPEMIVVGIGYAGRVDRASPEYRANRSRDYTPTFVEDSGYGREYQKESGGAPSFATFLEDELIPALEKRYRLIPGDRTLVGHSYGGLFVTYAKLHRPSLFSGILAVSPSLWYDDHWSFRNEARYAAETRSLPGRIYLAVGSRERNTRHDMVADLERFGAQLESRDYDGLVLRFEVLDGETHNSVFPRALTNGLRFLFPSREGSR